MLQNCLGCLTFKFSFRLAALVYVLLHFCSLSAHAQTQPQRQILVAQVEPSTANLESQKSKQKVLQDWPLEKAYELALYDYFQGDFFAALSQFEALQALHPEALTRLPERLTGNKIEAELLKGGISLAYGLEEQAQDIFSRLLSRPSTEAGSTQELSDAETKTKTLAWLLLGKIYYQKRQFTAASEAFLNIEQEDAEDFLPRGLRDEWLYLQAQLQAKNFPTACDSDCLVELSKGSIYRDYINYNQALALLARSRADESYPETAIDMLTALGQKQAGVFTSWLDGWWTPLGQEQEQGAEEFYALKDRANLTLGYTYLQQQKPLKAQEAFQQVRMQSLDTQAALLGYGWAAATDKDYPIALAIWQQLRESVVPSEYVLEAYLASAYAYEKAFAPTQALAMLQQALERYQQELGVLAQAKDNVADEDFIYSLLESDLERGSGFAGHDPAQTYLSAVLLSNDFRAKITALNQSRKIQQQLQNWQQRMSHYHLMLDERQDVRLQRSKQLLHNRLLEDLSAHQSKREQLASQIKQAQQDGDGMLLLEDEFIPIQHRLTRAIARQQDIVQSKEQLAQSPLKDKYRKRLERLQGILAWQASEQYEENLRQGQKQLKALDDALAKVQQQQEQLLALLADTPDFALQRQRIAAIEQRLGQQETSNNTLQQSLLSDLRGLLGEMLDRHMQKIQAYQVQAQLSVVRLNDQAFKQAIEDQQIPAESQGSRP